MGEFFVYEKQKVIRAVFAEFFGTLFLVHLGCQSVVSTVSEEHGAGVLLPAIAFATIVASLVVVIGPTSGCHLNPCVTIPLVIIRRIPPLEAFLYIIAQFSGAITGAATLYGITPREMVEASSLGMNLVREDLAWHQAIINEMILTSFLVLVVLVVTEPELEKKNYHGCPAVSVAHVLVAVISAGGVYTGASVNTARSFGPALIMLNFHRQWIYFVGPPLGSLLGLAFYKLIFEPAIVDFEKPHMVVKLAESDSDDESKSNKKSRSKRGKYANKPFIVVGTEDEMKKSKESNHIEDVSEKELAIRALPFEEADTEASVVKADLETLNRSNVTEVTESNA